MKGKERSNSLPYSDPYSREDDDQILDSPCEGDQRSGHNDGSAEQREHDKMAGPEPLCHGWKLLEEGTGRERFRRVSPGHSGTGDVL